MGGEAKCSHSVAPPHHIPVDECSIAAERVSDESETLIDSRTTSLESSQPRLRKKEGIPSELTSRMLRRFQKMNCLCEWGEDNELKFLSIWMLSIELFILERERHGGEARLDSTVSTKEMFDVVYRCTVPPYQ